MKRLCLLTLLVASLAFADHPFVGTWQLEASDAIGALHLTLQEDGT